MLCIVPVEAAGGIEGLVVSGIEELVGEVEDVLLVSAGCFDLCCDSVERDVAGDDIFSSPLLAASGLLKPAAHLHVVRSGSVVVVNVELADHFVLLAGIYAEHRLLVGVDVSQIEVGLLYEGQQILDSGLAQGHRDMCNDDSPRIATRSI